MTKTSTQTPSFCVCTFVQTPPSPPSPNQVGANAGVVGMTKEHLGLALALSVPVFVVVTKMDMCPANVLQDTMRLLVRILKSPGCRKIPVVVHSPDDVVVCATNFVSERRGCSLGKDWSPKPGVLKLNWLKKHLTTFIEIKGTLGPSSYSEILARFSKKWFTVIGSNYAKLQTMLSIVQTVDFWFESYFDRIVYIISK